MKCKILLSFLTFGLLFNLVSLVGVKATSDYSEQIYDIDFLFSSAKSRQISSTMPFSKLYNELESSYSDVAILELLAGIIYYQFYKKAEWAEYSTEIVEWLDDRLYKKDLFYRYNTTSSSFSNVWGERFSNFFPLIKYVDIYDSSYDDLLSTVANAFITQFINTTSNLFHTGVDYDGTITDSKCSCYYHSQAMSMLAYASKVLDDEYLEDLAIDMALAFPLSSLNIPYETVYQNGTAYDNKVKEDMGLGIFLSGLVDVYYYTGSSNVGLKSLIKDVASAGATYFWHESNGRFVYKVNADTGEYDSSNTVHGFGLLDEALVKAYLIHGNVTWLYRARSDFDDLVVVDGHLLKNDLICHEVNEGNSITYDDATLAWDLFGHRFANVLYNLDYTETYLKSAYLEAYSDLYDAVSDHHRYSKGWVVGVDATDLTISTRYEYYRYTFGLTDSARAFTTREFDTVKISDLDGFYEAFGNTLFDCSILTSPSVSMVNYAYVEVLLTLGMVGFLLAWIKKTSKI